MERGLDEKQRKSIYISHRKGNHEPRLRININCESANDLIFKMLIFYILYNLRIIQNNAVMNIDFSALTMMRDDLFVDGNDDLMHIGI